MTSPVALALSFLPTVGKVAATGLGFAAAEEVARRTGLATKVGEAAVGTVNVALDLLGYQGDRLTFGDANGNAPETTAEPVEEIGKTYWQSLTPAQQKAYHANLLAKFNKQRAWAAQQQQLAQGYTPQQWQQAQQYPPDQWQQAWGPQYPAPPAQWAPQQWPAQQWQQAQQWSPDMWQPWAPGAGGGTDPSTADPGMFDGGYDTGAGYIQGAGGVVERVKDKIRRVVCPGHEAGPIVAGTGEEVVIKQCEGCLARALGTAEQVRATYLGWAQAYGVPEEGLGDACGKMPAQDSKKYRTFWGNFDSEKFNADLVKWQSCSMTATADKAKAQQQQQNLRTKMHQAESKAVAKTQESQRRAARAALQAQQKKFEDQIAAMKQAQADAKTQADKDALQQQINQLTAQKNDAATLATTLQAQAKDAATQQKIDALTQQLAQSAAKPGGMDNFFQQLMMAKMMEPAAAPAPAPQQPPIIIQPGAPAPAPAPQGPPPMPWGAPPQMMPDMGPPQPQIVVVAPDGGDEGSWLEGDADDLADPELAQLLGVEGAETIGEVQMFYDIRNNPDWKDDEIMQGLAGCGGSCGLPYVD